MSHRISRSEALRKYDDEKESQRLNKQGVRPKVSRHEKKRRMRLSKTKQFLERLRFRGGHFEQKKPKKPEALREGGVD